MSSTQSILIPNMAHTQSCSPDFRASRLSAHRASPQRPPHAYLLTGNTALNKTTSASLTAAARRPRAPALGRRRLTPCQAVSSLAGEDASADEGGPGAPSSAEAAAAPPEAGAGAGPADQIIKYITNDAEVSVIALVGTGLVQDAQRRHSLAPTSAAALGRLLMGTLLLGAKQGPGEVVQVAFNGRGPIGRMTAVAADTSHVKGFVGNPACDPPLNDRGKMDVGAAVGQGVITVVRTHPSWQQAYTGTVPIQTGEVAEDLAHYLAESEQVNCALGLGVAVGRDGATIAAGGFLVQVLPFCSEETLQVLERNVSSMPAVSDLVQAGEGSQGMAARLLQGLGFRQAGEEVTPTFGPCGAEVLQPRMAQAIVSLGREQVDDIIREQGVVEVRCEFCAETLRFSADDLEPLLQEQQQGRN